MRYLLDTNCVVRAVNRDDALYPMVTAAVQRLSSRGDELIVVPQVIYEFWSVATRPAQANGLGWQPSLVRAVVHDFVAEWSFLADIPDVFDNWLMLVTMHEVRGKQVHDARLAAAAQAHGIDYLLTLNVSDFKRFRVESLHPRDMLA